MTRRTSEGLRLMAVHAHPDDESSKGAATMARYVDEGARVMVVTCTGGERGDVLNPRIKDDPRYAEDLLGMRREEMAAAAKILGIEHAWLGYEDSGYPDGLDSDNPPELPQGCFARHDVSEAAKPLIELIREFRPHVVTTYNEIGGYPHPDHIMCHKISREAFCAAGNTGDARSKLPAWQPLKLYYDVGFSASRTQVLHEALLAAGKESPFEPFLEMLNSRPPRPVHARIACADYFHQKSEALLAHASQIDPDGLFFVLSNEELAQLWPTEEFERAASHVDVLDDEDDLFAGIRGTSYVQSGAPLDSPAEGYCS